MFGVRKIEWKERDDSDSEDSEKDSKEKGAENED